MDIRSVLIGGGVATAMAAVLFVLFPEIDLAVASFFYNDQDQKFLLRDNALAAWIRAALQNGFMLLCLAAVLSLAVSVLWGRRLFGLGSRQATYLIICFGLGPGVLVNAILKNHWGRARPSDVIEFGGEQQFTPALIIADQCERNCSFVSGEAAMGFSVLAVALLASPRWRPLSIWACLALGCFIGFLRMGVGKHFLSDVVFAGLFMLLLIVIVHHVMMNKMNRHKVPTSFEKTS